MNTLYPPTSLQTPSLAHAAAAIFAALSLTLTIALLPTAAAAHLDDNLIGVPPSEPAEWTYYGISPEESTQWIREGIIFAAWAAQWRGEGFSAASAGQWHQIANVYTAGDFLQNGFSPEEARTWMNQGIKSGRRAREYLSAGLDAGEAATFWRKGIYPEDAKEWRNAGFDAAAMLAWRYGPRMNGFYFTKDSPSSQAVYDVEFAARWRDAGFTAAEAQRAGSYRIELAEAKKWQGAGFSFNETVQWLDSGFTLQEAAAGREAGLSAIEAERRRYAASAKEDEIAKLHADITVSNDGTLDIVETVTVIDRPGGDYREGYSRDAPAAGCRTASAATLFSSPRMRVKAVEVDGRPGEHEPAAGVLVFRKNGAPLPEGEHRITLAYSTDRLVLDEPHHDELCFVIAGGIRQGNSMRQASATIRLPKGAQVIFAGGHAGLPERKDLVREIEETPLGDIVRYTVTRPLSEGMGFSVDLGFIKGYARPTLRQQLVLWDRESNRFLSSLLLFFSGLALSFCYYWLVWFRVGRDPLGSGVEATEFSPPADVDPAGMRAFLNKGGTDHLSVAAQLLSLAERGTINIFESEGSYTITSLQSVSPALPEREHDFLAELFQEGKEVILTGRTQNQQLALACRRLKSALHDEYRRQTERNARYLWPVLIVSVPLIGASLAIIDRSELMTTGDAGAALTAYAACQAAG